MQHRLWGLWVRHTQGSWRKISSSASSMGNWQGIKGVFDYPMPRYLAQEVLEQPHAHSLQFAAVSTWLQVDGKDGWVTHLWPALQLVISPLCRRDTWGRELCAAIGPASRLESHSLENVKDWESFCPTSQHTHWPSPWLPGLTSPTHSDKALPCVCSFVLFPHFASSERGSCSSVNTIFESSHAVWAQILALIYCCVHFTALKSSEFKSPLNTIGDTRRPVFWSSPVNGYKFESRQQGSRAGKD